MVVVPSLIVVISGMVGVGRIEVGAAENHDVGLLDLLADQEFHVIAESAVAPVVDPPRVDEHRERLDGKRRVPIGEGRKHRGDETGAASKP